MLGAHSAGAGTPTSQAARVSAAQAATKISPDLLDSFVKAGPGGKVHYWVILADQADTSNNIPNSQWADKGWYVYNTLTDKANSTQKPLLAKLNALKQAGNVTGIESFWIVNFIAVTGRPEFRLKALAAEPAVSLLQLPENGVINDTSGSDASLNYPQVAQVLKGALTDIQMASAQANPLAPLLVQHNLNEVHAPQAWALGYDGTGSWLARWTPAYAELMRRLPPATAVMSHRPIPHTSTTTTGLTATGSPIRPLTRPGMVATQWAPRLAYRPTPPTATSVWPKAPPGSPCVSAT